MFLAAGEIFGAKNLAAVECGMAARILLGENKYGRFVLTAQAT